MTATVTQDGVRDAHVVVPFAETAGAPGHSARLGFDNGLSRVELLADPDMHHLLEAWFADPVPLVWAAGHNVHVEYPLGARLLRRARPSTVRINPREPWALDVHGGAAHLRADLSAVDVRSIAVHSGAAHTDLTLGHPTGPRTIRLSSVKDLRLRRPAGVPVRVEIAKGATSVTLDDRGFGAVGGGLADQTPGYDRAGARYLLVVSGGADTITIETDGKDAP